MLDVFEEESVALLRPERSSFHGVTMKYHLMQAFVAVATAECNISRAARETGTSQPGLSQSISTLETEIGLKLFDRSRRKLAGLSDAGRELLPIAMQAIASHTRFASVARQLRHPTEGVLNLAMGPSPARLLPNVVQRFGRKFPKMRVQVHFAPVEQIIEQISIGAADVCLCSDQAGLPEVVEFRRCYEMGWDLLALPDHALTGKPSLSLEDIAPFPLVTYDDSFGSHAQLLAAFEKRSLVPRIALGLGDITEMKRCAEAGLGVAILRSDHRFYSLESKLVTRSLDDVLQPTTIYVGVRADEPSGSAARAFARFLRLETAAIPSDQEDA